MENDNYHWLEDSLELDDNSNEDEKASNNSHNNHNYNVTFIH